MLNYLPHRHHRLFFLATIWSSFWLKHPVLAIPILPDWVHHDIPNLLRLPIKIEEKKTFAIFGDVKAVFFFFFLLRINFSNLCECGIVCCMFFKHKKFRVSFKNKLKSTLGFQKPEIVLFGNECFRHLMNVKTF